MKLIKYAIDVALESFYFKHGMAKDSYDKRDWKAEKIEPVKLEKRPRFQFPPIYAQNQKNTPHCVAYSTAAVASLMCRIKLKKQVTVEGNVLAKIMISEGLLGKNGAFIRDGAKTVCKHGLQIKGTSNIFKPFGYASVEKTVNAFKSRLQNGQPIMTGAMIASPMITFKEKIFKPVSRSKSVGGHAFCCVSGWDDGQRVFLCQNSWGEKWGNKGAFFIRYEDINHLFTPYVFLTNKEFIK